MTRPQVLPLIWKTVLFHLIFFQFSHPILITHTQETNNSLKKKKINVSFNAGCHEGRACVVRGVWQRAEGQETAQGPLEGA